MTTHMQDEGPWSPAGAGGATTLALPGRFRIRRRGGWRLPGAVRRHMESVFGTSFDDVRVFTGQEASALGLTAFALGRGLYFAPGRFDPDTPAGRFLIGHELTHVLQQRAGRVPAPAGPGLALVADPLLEAEADAMGRAAA